MQVERHLHLNEDCTATSENAAGGAPQ